MLHGFFRACAISRPVDVVGVVACGTGWYGTSSATVAATLAARIEPAHAAARFDGTSSAGCCGGKATGVCFSGMSACRAGGSTMIDSSGRSWESAYGSVVGSTTSAVTGADGVSCGVGSSFATSEVSGTTSGEDSTSVTFSTDDGSTHGVAGGRGVIGSIFSGFRLRSGEGSSGAANCTIIPSIRRMIVRCRSSTPPSRCRISLKPLKLLNVPAITKIDAPINNKRISTSAPSILMSPINKAVRTAGRRAASTINRA